MERRSSRRAFLKLTSSMLCLRDAGARASEIPAQPSPLPLLPHLDGEFPGRSSITFSSSTW
jgi:hypothetical protein